MFYTYTFSIENAERNYYYEEDYSYAKNPTMLELKNEYAEWYLTMIMIYNLENEFNVQKGWLGAVSIKEEENE